MAKSILKKSSFGLCRTNPKLSTNIKLIVNSNDNLFLESFDEIQDLSDSRFKGFKVNPNSNYSYDLFNFYDKGSVPKEIAYKLFKKDDSLSVKNSYSLQYDMTYCMGAFTKTSKLYDEEYGLFAPLWIEPNNIPDYFIILKTEDPVSINTKNLVNEEDESFISAVGASNLDKNILEKSQVIKVFDLTKNSNLGQYIRNHASNPLFPESPLTARFNRDEMSEWNGISYSNGGFFSFSNFVHQELMIQDKPIMEFENFITNGFQRGGVVASNLMNLEFLFDDNTSENYEINRFFGMYVNASELGKFKLDGDKLFEDRKNEPQTPKPTLLGNIGYDYNTESKIQSNPNGIKLYGSVTEGILPQDNYFDKPRIGYVKDKNDNFYSIKNGGSWKNQEEIRINQTQIDWQNFTGFTSEIDSIKGTIPNTNGRPYIALKIIGQPNSGDVLRIRNVYDVGSTGGATGSNLSPIEIESYTITADASESAGSGTERQYSPNGTNTEIARSIAIAINNIRDSSNSKEIFRAVSSDNYVLIFSRIQSENWNSMRFQSFSTSANEKIEVYSGTEKLKYSETNYFVSSPASSIDWSSGYIIDTTLSGGNESSTSRIIIGATFSDIFIKDQSYLKTDQGYSKIINITHYLDEPIYNSQGDISSFNNWNSYYVVTIENNDHSISLNSAKQCTIYETVENSTGFFSMYPIKDFDFDFFNTDYNKTADSTLESFQSYIINTLGGTGATVTPYVIGSTSIFTNFIGFIDLVGAENEDDGSINTNIVTEYDRLNENEITTLAVASRVVPLINKWVYDDLSTDVRENHYRFNVSESFRFSNFSPSFKEVTQNPKFYTHEWYYLQKFPPYMTLEEKKNSYSYFNNELIVSDLYNVDDNKFEDYFIVNQIGSTTNIDTKFKYSIFTGGTTDKFAESFFRGVKVQVRERVENTNEINFNKDEIKYKKTSKFNGYKFSSVLKFNDSGRLNIQAIKNEKFKNITLVIESSIDDEIFTNPGSTGATADRFIDRSVLYNLSHKYDLDKINSGATADIYKDTTIDGSIQLYTFNSGSSNFEIIEISPGVYKIPGVYNPVNNTFPRFSRDIISNDVGVFQDIEIQLGSNLLKFSNISSVSDDYFICSTILYNGSPIPVTFSSGWPSNTQLLGLIPNYKGGGFNAYVNEMSSISFANIAELINNGDPIIQYITIGSTGQIIEEDFVLELIEPEYIVKATYLNSIGDDEKPTSLSLSQNIGSKLSALERTYLNPLARYNGNYSPRVKDVIFYNNDITGLKSLLESDFVLNGATADVDNLIDNVTFDVDNSNFGIIPNYYFNKVNEENPKTILELDKTKGNLSRYPKINEIAIDKKDFYIFKSNWDIDYYNKYLNKKDSTKILGTRNMIEQKSFLGSKMMEIPDEIILQDVYELIDFDELGSLDLISNVSANVVSNITERSSNTSKSVNPQSDLTLNIFIEKALRNYLVNDGISLIFNKFVNPQFSDELTDTVSDDVDLYIQNNIVNRYVIDEIVMYEKIFANNDLLLNNVELNLTTADLINKGYSESKNFRVDKSINSDLDFSLIYNITKGKNYSISFKVTLKKK